MFVRHTMLFVLLATPIIMLQFFSPPTSAINIGRSVDVSKPICWPFGDVRTRATDGVFHIYRRAIPIHRDCGSYGDCGLANTKTTEVNTLKPAYRLHSCDNGDGGFSQSRTAFVKISLLVFVLWLLGILSNSKKMVLRVLVLPSLLLGAVAILWPMIFPESYESFSARWESAATYETRAFRLGVAGRAIYPLYAFIYYLDDTPVIGHLMGLGNNLAIRRNWVDWPRTAIQWSGFGQWAQRRRLGLSIL